MHVLLTGASSGIGAALARALAKAGHDLTLVARRQNLLEEVAESCGGVRSLILPYDLSELSGLKEVVEKSQAELGPIDVLVNNAGVQIVALTEEVAIEDADRLLTVDLRAPFHLNALILPQMIERRSGVIVDIASLAALAPTPGMYYYNAAKAALAAASESLRPELKRHGIHVVTVYPGPVETDMANKAVASYHSDPMRGLLPVGHTDVLAKRILTAIRRRKDRVIYPRMYTVTRWLPTLTHWVMSHFSPLPRSKQEA